MYKLILIAAVFAVSAQAGVVFQTAPVVTHVTQNEVVGHTAHIQRERVAANVPASTQLIKDTNVITPVTAPVTRTVVNTPVVQSVVAAPVPVTRTVVSSPVVQTVQTVQSPVVYSAGVPVHTVAGVHTVAAGSPLVYSAGVPVQTVVNGARFVQVTSPVENHGYQVVY